MLVDVHHGECLDVLRQLADASVDAIVTDPPYGLSDLRPDIVTAAVAAWLAGDREHVPDAKGFMGRSWDAFVPPPAVWDECLRVLKPGGHLLAFAGSRSADLMGLSVRLAGFEIRDEISCWITGQGFPKGRSQLKPAHEPIIVARKPMTLSMVANVAEHGTGALQIDVCRVAASEEDRERARVPMGEWSQSGTTGATAKRAAVVFEMDSAGRWPSNVVFAHAEACGPDDTTPCVKGCPVAALDGQSGVGLSKRIEKPAAPTPNIKTWEGGPLNGARPARGYTDEGGASRFFPTFRYQAKAPAAERPEANGVRHPTVKPLALMQWLVRLVTPPGGLVVDPFAGSGTTAEACIKEGFGVICIEREAEYIPLIHSRIDRSSSTSVCVGAS